MKKSICGILLLFAFVSYAQDMIVSGGVTDAVDGTYLDTGEYDNTRYYKKQNENLYLFRRTIADGDTPGGYWFIGATVGQIAGNTYGRVYNQFSSPYQFPPASPSGETLNKNGINQLVPYPRIITANTPTPVELTSFGVELSDNKALLNWETATEVNNYGFEVHRKFENEEWNQLGFVEGHGNSNSQKYYSFTDKTTNISGQYSYRLKQVDIDGTYEYSDVVEVIVSAPLNFNLNQNYPNPFNPTTSINYSIPLDGYVTLSIYDLLGNEVAQIENGNKVAGSYSNSFDASKLTSGFYFYTIRVGNFIETKKMLLIK